VNRGPRGEERRRREAARERSRRDSRTVPPSAADRRSARRAEQARTPYAANWRTVLLADAAVGAVVFVLGVVLVLAVNVWIGAGVGALGASYDVLVLRRYRYWRELRSDAGLDD
jgi:hypothetical protein